MCTFNLIGDPWQGIISVSITSDSRAEGRGMILEELSVVAMWRCSHDWQAASSCDKDGEQIQQHVSQPTHQSANQSNWVRMQESHWHTNMQTHQWTHPFCFIRSTVIDVIFMAVQCCSAQFLTHTRTHAHTNGGSYAQLYTVTSAN